MGSAPRLASHPEKGLARPRLGRKQVLSAGKHIRSTGANRRAETVALHKALKKLID
jgi:hypothetical protein